MAVLNKVWGVDAWGTGRYSDPGFEPLAQAVSVSLGNVSLDVSDSSNPSGIIFTANTGAVQIRVDDTTPLTGEIASAVLGAVTPNVLPSTQGQVAGASVGTVATTIDCFIALSGQQAATSLTSVVPVTAVTALGLPISSGQGLSAQEVTHSAAGLLATATNGGVLTTVYDGVVLTGQDAVASVGNVSLYVTPLVTGVSAQGYIGSTVPKLKPSVLGATTAISVGTPLAGTSVLVGSFNVNIDLGEPWQVKRHGYDETYNPEVPPNDDVWVEVEIAENEFYFETTPDNSSTWSTIDLSAKQEIWQKAS